MTDYEKGYRDGIEAAAVHVATYRGEYKGAHFADEIRALTPAASTGYATNIHRAGDPFGCQCADCLREYPRAGPPAEAKCEKCPRCGNALADPEHDGPCGECSL